ncbi:hypothetical protein OIU77_003398 [Salix suchowensis]|uniref:Protein kinase domain-containing protein n=1 Tax=Salix suchowensis TaxID=1278906 RepID=A0ABQ9AZM2_9ROSI|nr:hypothetical protein OIU77_003398 [Salix suchowensis]
MSFRSVVSPLVLFILCCCSLIQAQQPYVGRGTTKCSNTKNSTLGYSCNGLNRSCQAYLIFRSQHPYTTVASISTLLGSDPSQLSQINSVSETTSFPTNQLVLVPVNCSCSGDYFQANASYVVQSDVGRALEANEISEQATIYPFTTLLIPLQNPPTSSQTVVPPPPPPSPPASPSPSPPSPNSDQSSNKTWVYVVIGVAGGIVLTLLIGTIIFFMFFCKSKKQPGPIIVSQSFEAHEKPHNKNLDEEPQDLLESAYSIAQSLKVYSYEDLIAATDNFSPSCWIKGSVFRGRINGDLAAIKKMNGDVSKEVELLNKINHSNLIRLSGVCFNDGQWCLVYEYAVNGPLSDWIYVSSNEGKFLKLTERIQIATDVATGLSYLHSFTNYPHVHKDIKSSNILLDSDLRAKIANFSLARSTDGPEGEFAEENRNLSDVLNGVLSEEGRLEESLSQLIDPSMQGNYPSGLAVLILRLIVSCLNKNPSDRPAMDEIVQSLTVILTASLAWELSNNTSSHRSSDEIPREQGT